MVILALNIKESNEIFRLAIIRNYFEPELLKMDYRRSFIKHPLSKESGLNVEDVLHLYFDIVTIIRMVMVSCLTIIRIYN